MAADALASLRTAANALAAYTLAAGTLAADALAANSLVPTPFLLPLPSLILVDC